MHEVILPPSVDELPKVGICVSLDDDLLLALKYLEVVIELQNMNAELGVFASGDRFLSMMPQLQRIKREK